jgi:hypothetical protein
MVFYTGNRLRASPERENASLALIQGKNGFEAKMVIFVFFHSLI